MVIPLVFCRESQGYIYKTNTALFPPVLNETERQGWSSFVRVLHFVTILSFPWLLFVSNDKEKPNIVVFQKDYNSLYKPSQLDTITGVDVNALNEINYRWHQLMNFY